MLQYVSKEKWVEEGGQIIDYLSPFAPQTTRKCTSKHPHAGLQLNLICPPPNTILFMICWTTHCYKSRGSYY